MIIFLKYPGARIVDEFCKEKIKVNKVNNYPRLSKIFFKKMKYCINCILPELGGIKLNEEEFVVDEGHKKKSFSMIG